jgi:hypothetical protein
MSFYGNSPCRVLPSATSLLLHNAVDTLYNALRDVLNATHDGCMVFTDIVTYLGVGPFTIGSNASPP